MFRRRLSLPTATAVTTRGIGQVGVYNPKSDIWLDKFDATRELNESQIRTGEFPEFNTNRVRNMFWRFDEATRRAEANFRAQGFFFMPTLDFPIHRGVMPLFSSAQVRMHVKHHKAYIAKLNTLIKGTEFEGQQLDAIVKASHNNPVSSAVFNNAAQHYNHMFFWKSITPFGSVCPPDLVAQLTKQYGSVEQFQQVVTDAGMSFFGSGWLWIVYDEAVGGIDILTVGNAGCALTTPGVHPLMAVDLWEHTWYIDYENEKKKYLDNFWKVADWHWMERNWKRASGQPYTPMTFQ